MFSKLIKAAAIAAPVLLATGIAASAHIIIEDGGYTRTSNQKTGGGFFTITNHNDYADRLIGVKSDEAKKTELHTHIISEDGVARMREIEGGIDFAPHESHVFKRGGDHVMFMGLNDGWENGDEVHFILIFEKSGEVPVTLTVDNDRQPKHAHAGHDHSGHGEMDHDKMDHSGH